MRTRPGHRVAFATGSRLPGDGGRCHDCHGRRVFHACGRPCSTAPLSLSILPPNSTSGIAPEPKISADAHASHSKRGMPAGRRPSGCERSTLRQCANSTERKARCCRSGRRTANRWGFSPAANSSGSISLAVRRVSWPTLRSAGRNVGRAGVVVFIPTPGGLYRVNASGGDARQIARPDASRGDTGPWPAALSA